MGPPSLFVGFGKGQAHWEPDENVVVQGTAFLKLCYPDISHVMAASLHPLADSLDEVGDV
jgi:hypothetical protein